MRLAAIVMLGLLGLVWYCLNKAPGDGTVLDWFWRTNAVTYGTGAAVIFTVVLLVRGDRRNQTKDR